MKNFTNHIKKEKLLFLFLTLLLLCNSLVSFGLTKTANTSGPWSSNTTWSGQTPPGAGDVVVINSGITVTVTDNRSCTSIGFALSYANAGSIIINEGFTLTVSGAITFKVATNTGTTLINVGNGNLICGGITLAATNVTGKFCELLINNGSVTTTGITSGGINSKLTFTGTGTLKTSGAFMTTAPGTFSCGNGTIEFISLYAQNVGGANCNYTFNNLTLAGSGIKSFASIYGGNINTIINGVLTMQGTAICALTNSDMFTYGPYASLKYDRTIITSVGVEWPSTFTASGGVTIAGTIATTLPFPKTLATGVPLLISPGATLVTNGLQLTLGGNFTKYGFLTTGGSTISLIGNADQSIADITTKGSLEIIKTGGVATLNGPLDIGTLKIDGGGTLNLNSYPHDVTTLQLYSGTLNAATSTLAVGVLDKTNGIFIPGTSTVNWKNPFSDISKIEYYNLKLSNNDAKPTSYQTTGDITIIGDLTLEAQNPSATAALLDMGARTLHLGANAKILGAGDVSGIVERTSFNPNTNYSFSNANTSLSLSNGGTMPTSIKVKTSIGYAPTNKSAAVKRYYEIIQTGGANVNVNLRAHYLGTELNSNIEKALVIWKYDIVAGDNQNFTEVGKTSYNYTNKYIEVSNIPISIFPTSFDNLGFTVAISASPTYIWSGLDAINFTDWNEPNNWDPIGVPGLTSNVIIPDGLASDHYPVVDAINVKTISIESYDAIFDGSTYDITVNGGVGAWSDPGGKFICGTNKVNFTNPDATINGNTIFYDLTVADGAKVTIDQNSHIYITNALSINGNGSVDAVKSPNTIEYLGTGINLPSNLSNYHNLILNGAHTMPAVPLKVNGDLTFTGSALNTAADAIIIKGNLSIDALSEFNTANKELTLGGDFVNLGTFTNVSSNINFAFETPLQEIDPFVTSGTVSMLKPSGIVKMNGVFTSGNLIINGALGELDFNTYIATINGDVTLAAGILRGGSSAITVNGISNSTWNGNGLLFDFGNSTVNFNAIGNQKITATDASFNMLNFGGTGTKTIAAPTHIYGDFYAGGEFGVTEADIYVEGALEVDAATEFTAGNNLHSVYGNFINNGDFYATNGSVLALSGNFTNGGLYDAQTGSTLSMISDYTNQIIESNTDLNVYNLTQNNNFGTTLMTPTTVANALNLNNNNILTSSTDILKMGSNSSVAPIGGSAASYVVGPVEKSGSSAFVFPVGKVDHYAPIAIGDPSTSTTFTAEYFENGHQNCNNWITNLTKVSQVEYWDLNRSIGTGTANVILFWTNAAHSGIGTTTALRVAHYNGTAWENVTEDVVISDNTGSGTIKANTNVNSFSPFTFGTIDNSGNMLPVELISFNAECNNDKIEVNWTTASEENNEYFEIQRSENGKEFATIGKLAGAINSNDLRSYKFIDNEPKATNEFYRLLQVDVNGKYSFSKIVQANCNASLVDDFELYPNPTKGDIIINVSDELIGSTYSITNLYNQVLYNGSLENAVLHINVSELRSGIYMVLIKTTSGEILQKRLIVE